MVNSRVRAQPPLEFIPPKLNLWVLRSLKAILPLWLKLNTTITQVQAEGVETLADLYHQFQQGKIRLLVAFRHSSLDDSATLDFLLWRLMPQVAKKKGIQLKSPIHIHYLYDRGIPLWMGAWVGWLFSNLGCTPIQRGKVDMKGLKAARQLLANSNLPMAIAPEGAASWHHDKLNPLEPGAAFLSFWCIQDLLKAGRTEEAVMILPIEIRYRFISPPWREIDQLLTQLEQDSGLPPGFQSSETNDPGSALAIQQRYQRLKNLAAHGLALMEQFYTKFYHRTFPQSATAGDAPTLSERLQHLIEVALTVAEEYFNVPRTGDRITRCRRIEQAAWDCIYRDELQAEANLSPVERGLADFVAQEASLRMWHMQLAENFVSITGDYLEENPTAERFADMALLLWNFVNWTKGNTSYERPQLGKQQATLVVGDPLSVSERWNDYKRDRAQTIATLTEDLQVALETLNRRR